MGCESEVYIDCGSVLVLPVFLNRVAYLDGREGEVAWWAEGRGREGEAEDVSALID